MLRKQPRIFKWKKAFKQKVMSQQKVQNNVGSRFGYIGIKALEAGKLQYSQIESIRRVLLRFCRKSSKVWFHSLFSVALTKKPSEVRMGKGKGKLDRWVTNVFAGQILLEMEDIHYLKAAIIFQKLSRKAPVKLCLIIGC